MVSSVSVSSDVTFFLLDTVHIHKIPQSNWATDLKVHEGRLWMRHSLLYVITDSQSLSVNSQRFLLWFALVSELWLCVADESGGVVLKLVFLPVWLSVRQKSDL